MVDSPGGATPTLQSEIFIQSDRMAAFVLMGILRWGLVAMLGLIFPFLIVSAANITDHSVGYRTHFLSSTLTNPPTTVSFPECPELLLLPALFLHVPAGLCVHLPHPARDQRKDPDGDLCGVQGHQRVRDLLLRPAEHQVIKAAVDTDCCLISRIMSAVISYHRSSPLSAKLFNNGWFVVVFFRIYRNLLFRIYNNV